jgi:ABC-2 type transport system permease protein
MHSGVTDRMLAVQAGVMLGLALALGVRVPGGLAGSRLMLAAAALLGAGVGAASHALALLARKQETMFAVMNFVLLPATFVSTILMTDRLMPDWMRRVAALNPVNWAAELARGALNGLPLGDLIASLSLLAAFALLCAAAAAAAFHRYRHAT